MSDPIRLSASLLSSETEKWAWDVQELDPDSPYLYVGRSSSLEQMRTRLKDFLASHHEDVVHMDATAMLAKFLSKRGHGKRTHYCTLEVPTDIIRQICTFFDKGGFAGLNLDDYLEAMA